MKWGMAAFLYEFEWDPVKAQTNFNKHGMDFERAATVFLDPLAATIPDEEHSETSFGGLRWEERPQAVTRWWSILLSGWPMIGDASA